MVYAVSEFILAKDLIFTMIRVIHHGALDLAAMKLAFGHGTLFPKTELQDIRLGYCYGQ